MRFILIRHWCTHSSTGNYKEDFWEAIDEADNLQEIRTAMREQQLRHKPKKYQKGIYYTISVVIEEGKQYV